MLFLKQLRTNLLPLFSQEIFTKNLLDANHKEYNTKFSEKNISDKNIWAKDVAPWRMFMCKAENKKIKILNNVLLKSNTWAHTCNLSA